MSIQQMFFASLAAGGGYVINGSGLFDGAAKLSRTPSSSSNLRTWTTSMVVKFGQLPDYNTLFGAGNNDQRKISLHGGGSGAATLSFHHNDVADGGASGNLTSTASFRDPSAFYHIVFAMDTTQSTASNRIKLYVNGIQITDFSSSTYPLQNTDWFINDSGHATEIGESYHSSIDLDYHGYIASFALIDGLQLTPSSFGETTDDGYWSILDPSGLTFGTNGFLLSGSDVATGTDTSQGGTLADQQLRFLCSFDGSDAATSSTDDSTYGQTITFTADAQLDTAQKKFGTASLLLDGTGDFVSIPDTSIVEIGSQDFTIDMQVRFTTLGAIRTLMAKWHSTGNNRSFLLYWENSAAQLQFLVSSSGSGGISTIAESWSPSTDTWYHVAVERTGGKIHLYVDGTMLGSGTANTTAIFDAATPLTIGAYQSGSQPFLGHIDEPRFIIGDGVYGGSNFTAPSAAYSNPTAGNNFIATGTITQPSDSGTNDADNDYGNYATFNPLISEVNSSRAYADGNRKVTLNNADDGAETTMFVPSGSKGYCEITIVTDAAEPTVGIRRKDSQTPLSSTNLSGTLEWGYRGNGQKRGGGASAASYGDTFTAGDVIGVAIDTVNGALWFSKDGTWQASATIGEVNAGTTTNAAFTGLAGHGYTFAVANSSSGTTGDSFTANFGATAFEYTQPTDFIALSTANLPTPSVINPADHFHSVVVAHDGSSTASTCSFNLETNAWLAIIKNTTGAVEKWYWINSLDGVNKYLDQAGSALVTDANVMSVSGTTFTLGSTLGNKSYLVEFHKAGLASATAANTSGTENTIATSENATSGFGMAQFASPSSGNFSIGHGFSVALSYVVTNETSRASSWLNWHTSLNGGSPGTTYRLNQNATTLQTSTANYWGSTGMTSTVMGYGTAVSLAASENVTVFYWHSVDGYSAFGSYTGNNSADGPMINMGGSPNSWFTKRIDSADTWQLVDVAVPDNDFNIVEERLSINATSIASSTAAMVWDRLSNGWKVRGNDSGFNASGGTYIYGAWGGRPMTDGSTNQGRAR